MPSKQRKRSLNRDIEVQLDSDRIELQTTIRGEGAQAVLAVFSPDGRVLASGGLDGVVRLWRIDSMECAQVLRINETEVRSIAFFPGRNALACASGDSVSLWNLADERCEAIFRGHKHYINAISFSPDGRTLASAGEDGTLRLWNTEALECRRIIEAHKGWAVFVAFSPKGGLVASGDIEEKSAKLWDPTSGELVCKLEHSDSVWRAAFSPSGDRLATASGDAVRIWNMDTRKCLITRRTLAQLQLTLLDRALAPPSDSFASFEQCQRYSEYLRERRRINSMVLSVDFSSDARFLVSGHNNGLMRMWDAMSGKLLNEIKAHTSSVWHVAISSDCRSLASRGVDITEDQKDRNIKLWRIDKSTKNIRARFT